MNNQYKKAIKVTILSVMVIAGTSMFNAYAGETETSGDFTRGVKAWTDNCTRCHNTRDPKELRDDQWRTTVYHMRVRANLTGQETRDILKFLQDSN